jgi:TPR repeat protein
MGRSYRVLLALLFLFVAIPIHADYQAGLDAFNAGDYTTAMSEWKEVVGVEPDRENLALYRESLYAIGMLYWHGYGVTQDYGVSAVWLKQAADINHPGAQNKLGYMHTMGQGLPLNYQEAVKWFQMAAAQGDAEAKHNLEVLFSKGLIPEPEEPVVEQAKAEADDEPEMPVNGFAEAWIRDQQPEHYTIQVIALSAPDKLHEFIAGNRDHEPFAIYLQTRYEQPLWVLVQGVYADVETARAARDAFPAGLQKRGELWIRKFEMVQRLIE